MTQDTGRIEELVTKLASDDLIERQSARHVLAEIGTPAISTLAELVDSPREQLRWEAAKALSAIADGACAPPLLKLLDDDDMGIRWVAGVGLINAGAGAVKPLLEALIHSSASGEILEGAHHVLHELSKTEWGRPLHRVMKAIETTEPGVTVPPEAGEVLEELTLSGVVSRE